METQNVSPCQDIKNADLALYELNRVITLEPNWPEVYEQRAEVRPELCRQVKTLRESVLIQFTPASLQLCSFGVLRCFDTAVNWQ